MSDRKAPEIFEPMEVVTTTLAPFSIMIDGDVNRTNLLYNSPNAQILKNGVSVGLEAIAGTTG